jgi:cation diffusion facilitator CzcD-associated flavoprotein CzcO
VTIVDSVTVARDAAREWLDGFAAAMRAGDASASAAMFRPDGYWRDALAFTWDLRTFAGPDRIGEGLRAVLPLRRPTHFALEDADPETFERKRLGPTIEAFFTFETDVARCRGHVRLLLEPGDGRTWKAWTVFTSLEDLKGFEERAGARRPVATDAAHGGTPGEGLTAEEHARLYETADPETVVIGAGQAGLAVAARLGRLGVPTLIVESLPRVGDNWRRRYQSLVLHNQVWANHLPYLPFPSSWPVYIAKDQLADWLESYASILSLAVWTSTAVVGGAYDEDDGRWTLTVRRADGSFRELRPRHVVQASGVFGLPNRTEIAGSERFEGRFLHATEYGGGEAADGTRALVVGSGSSAHDVAQDLHRCGADVTMLQRSSTCVVSVDPGAARAYSIYSEHSAPIEDCDMVTNAFPFPLLAELHKEMTRRIAELDAELLRGLRAAGFALDFGEDGSGFLMKYHRYGGGYYINVGASDLIVSGEVKVRQGVEIERVHDRTVRFTDGTSAPFDMIVVATGYQNMRESVRAIFGDRVADRVGPVWGFDAEGEPRAMWKPTGQPGLWLAGGSLQQCRPYSKYLALQIKARLAGLAS